MNPQQLSTARTFGGLLVLLVLLLLQFLALVPLLVYPAAAVASAMTLGAPLKGNEPFTLILIPRAFAILCLVYPILAIGASMAAWKAFSRRSMKLCLLWALLPVLILGIIGMFGAVWFLLS
ncbi:MAG: hypothetical protein WBH86_12345 [Thermogutta sp.]|nr:hypothetical protein [Thermogutta sp.]HPU07224.1 hypothetical protein [Thermogutta sp.]HPZ83290.1 hypothetical protein [Thermogutta sp.]HQF15144.1 hypothetical protein [Thermogutta sp.]